ncbi:MAG: tetratricopeptide repeat-containing sensor histidine kinase [Cyclobacteriaceae bacterium]
MSTTPQQSQYISDLLSTAYKNRGANILLSVELAEKALQLGKEIACKEYMAKGYSHLSLFSMIQGEYDKSLRLAEQAIKMYSDLEDDIGIADAMYNIAGVYYKTNNFHSGLIYLVDCLAIYKKHQDFHNQARVLKSLGTIYEYFGDITKAIESYQRAVEAGKKANDKDLQSNAYNPLSGIHLNRNETDKAMKLIKRSLQMKEETGDVRGLAFALYGRGKVFAKLKKYTEAEADYLQSLDIHTRMGEKLGRGLVLNKLGVLYHDMKKYDMAREKVEEALTYSIESNTAFIKYKAYYHLYLISKEENKKGEALEYLEKYLNEKENVINAQTHKVIRANHVISEEQNLEIEAQTQRERAQIIESKNRELDAFFYKVSHDLKSPISSIIGLDAVVRERVTDKEALWYFDIYKKQVSRINTMLDDLMRMAKVDNASIKKDSIDLAQLIHDCKASFAYLSNFNRIKFNIYVQEELDFKVERALINSIVQNLMENGIKYADLDKPFSELTFKAFKEEGNLRLISSDNGIGMNPETTDQMFEMFFRANHNVPGSGLGLYILKRAVDKLNGKIEVESVPKKGTTFTVDLPWV